MLEAVYLYVILHDDNSQGERFRTRMASIEQCYTAVEYSKITQPDSVGGDYEVIGVMWCGGDLERNYNAHWFTDKSKDLNAEEQE